MNTFEFTVKERAELDMHMRLNGMKVWREHLIDRIEQIVSERITPGQWVSGQSAEDILKGMYGNNTQYGYSFNSTIEAMRLHASQVCADKDREIDALNWAARMNRSDFLKAQSELDKANESLTVMVRKNAELEKEVKEAYDKGVSVGRRDI